ncbi:MAG: DUF6249 domain-containing protein [Pseudomonadota bacterium]
MEGRPEEVLVPLIVFSTFVALVALILWYQLSKKRAFLRFVSKHDGISVEAIKTLGQQFFSPSSDLRRGIFLLGIALAVGGFSLAVDFPQRGNLDLNRALFGIGLFPFFAGVAHLILYRLERR